jgi:hypothetical protein
MRALGWQETLIDLLERIANWFVAASDRRHRQRRKRRLEQRLPRRWPLVYPPPPDSTDVAEGRPQGPASP